MSGTTTLPKRVVVTMPFGDYARGAEITDESEIGKIYKAGQSHHVVATAEIPERKTTEAHEPAEHRVGEEG